jgi:hypothetical protein
MEHDRSPQRLRGQPEAWPFTRAELQRFLDYADELLPGAGAQTTVPSVLRLIDKLCEAGATNIVWPLCPHCARVIPLVKPRGGVRLCRNCVTKSTAEPCSGCGRVCEAATRDEYGRPLCPNCLVSDPANLRGLPELRPSPHRRHPHPARASAFPPTARSPAVVRDLAAWRSRTWGRPPRGANAHRR